MRKLLPLLLFLLPAIHSSAQQQPQFLGDVTQFGKPLDAPTGVQIEGDPYLFEGWRSGLIAMTPKAARFKVAKMRYNVLKEWVEFEQDGKVLHIDPRVFSIFMILEAGDTLRFQNKVIGIRNLAPETYIQILYDGNNRWLKKDSKILVNDPGAAYGSNNSKVIQSDRNFYLVKKNSEVISLKMNKKFFVKNFNVPGLEAFLKEESISFEKDNDLKRLFRWLDEKIN